MGQSSNWLRTDRGASLNVCASTQETSRCHGSGEAGARGGVIAAIKTRPPGLAPEIAAEANMQRLHVESAGASPAQVRPSKPPGSECCVRRRRRRTRSVHSGCGGCGSEPRNDELAGAETSDLQRRWGRLLQRKPLSPIRFEINTTGLRKIMIVWETLYPASARPSCRQSLTQNVSVMLA
jgi:hypothetical protein